MFLYILDIFWYIYIYYIIKARLSGWLENDFPTFYGILAFGGKHCKTWDDEDLFGKETMAGTIELYTSWPVARGSELHTFQGASFLFHHTLMGGVHEIVEKRNGEVPGNLT